MVRRLLVPAALAAGSAFASLHPWPVPGAVASVLAAVFQSIAWLAGAWFASRLLDLALPPAGRPGRGAHIPRLLSDLLHAILYALAVVAILAFVLEQPVAGLVATSGVVIAVMGFALRNVFGDIFAGIALNLEHPFRLGDWVEIGPGAAGQVVEINWRATRLLTLDGMTVVVPNGIIAGSRFINHSLPDQRVRVTVPVTLDQDVPQSQARRVLMSALVCAPGVLDDPPPDVLVEALTPNGVVYHARFWVPAFPQVSPMRDAVATAVLEHLERAGIGLARPKRDVRTRRRLQERRDSQGVAVALLRRIPLFAVFSDAEVEALARALVRREVPAGTLAVRQGDAGQSLFLVAEGVLDVTCVREGSVVTLARVRPGEVFGEMSLLSGQPRSANVVARIDAVVLELDKDQLDPILRSRPDLLERLARLMAARLEANENAGRRPPLAPDGDAARGGVPAEMLGRLRAFFHL